jgi:poly(3-hydroxybutyrate) depolymerase
MIGLGAVAAAGGWTTGKILATAAGLVAPLLFAVPASGESPVDAPLVGASVPRGTGHNVAIAAQAPSGKHADGDVADWAGQPSRFAGTSVYSAGEFIYQDHLFDAFGAADDRTAATYAGAEGGESAEPALGRATGLYQFFNDLTVGSAPLQDAADLIELRIAADADRVHLLARTNLLRDTDRTAALVLVDSGPGSDTRPVPFGSGIVSDTADVALLLTADRVIAADLATGEVSPLAGATAVTSHAADAIEASLPLSVFGTSPSLRLAVATGTLGDDGDFKPIAGNAARLANVAFRQEPVDASFDRRQALALHARTIDDFFTSIDLSKLRSGYSERYEPGPGYHARVFQSPAFVSEEAPGRTANREYGLYLPPGYNASRSMPITTYLHGSSGWTGATNHAWGALLPGASRDFGDLIGGIVIWPKDRQVPTKKAGGFQECCRGVSSGFFVSESLVELQTIWDDAITNFPADADRQYLTGYSMGGISTYLLPALMPDRFAAAHVTAGLIMDDKHYPSGNYFGQENWPQFSALKVFENYRHVPLSIFAGATDELTSYLENVDPVLRLRDLGYRHRLYTFGGDHLYEGLLDEWAEPARYMAATRRVQNPARVVLVRDMELERAVEVGNYAETSANEQVQFDFDSAFWVRDLVPVDETAGRATIDVRSHRIPEEDYQEALEAGGPSAPGQTGPYVMQGLAWQKTGLVTDTAKNAFTASVTGADAVLLDVGRMSIDTDREVVGDIKTDHLMTLRLRGDWRSPPRVTVNGQDSKAAYHDGVLAIQLPPGENVVSIGGRPSAARGPVQQSGQPTRGAAPAGEAGMPSTAVSLPVTGGSPLEAGAFLLVTAGLTARASRRLQRPAA